MAQTANNNNLYKRQIQVEIKSYRSLINMLFGCHLILNYPKEFNEKFPPTTEFCNEIIKTVSKSLNKRVKKDAEKFMGAGWN